MIIKSIFTPISKSFFGKFDKQDEDKQVFEVFDETEMFINLNINHKKTESDFHKFDNKSPLEHQIQAQEMKDSGWRFDTINSMIVYFYKTGEMDGRSFVKIPLRTSAILNFGNDDKFCFLWSLLACLHPCKNNHPYRSSNYRQHFNELNIQLFDFTKGFNCSDVHIFEKLDNLSINIFELNFFQDQNKCRYN